MKRNGTSKLNICFVRSLLVFLLLLALMLPMVSICCSAASVGSSILAAVYTDETYSALLRDDISICISGKLPRGAYAKAYPAGSNGFTGVVYAAYDITVFDGQGNVYEPGNSPLSVSMTSPAIAEAAKSGAEFDVYHIPDDSAPELVQSGISTDKEKNVSFEAESFSVYIIKDHEDEGYNEPARIEFHFIGDKATKAPFGDPATNTYKSPLYEFDNKNNEKQTSMILADGESLEKIENPANHGDEEFFYGWYVVNVDAANPRETVTDGGSSYDCVVYHWTDDPVLVSYNDVINVRMNAAQTALSWSINGVTVQNDLPLDDAKGCCGHVYLAPLYSNYRFVNFFSEPLDGNDPKTIPDERLLTRKLIALGANSMADVLLSDTTAPSPDTRHKIFVGWEIYVNPTKFNVLDSELSPVTGIYTTSSTGVPVKEGTSSDGYYLRCRDPQSDVNIYPMFSQARWFSFDTASNKEASYVSSVYMLTSESADIPDGTKRTKFDVSTRKGYLFNGWKVDTDKYDVQSFDLAGRTPSNLLSYMVTDSSGTVLAPAAGKTVRVCKKGDPSVVYYEILNDGGVGKLIIYDKVPVGAAEDNYIDGVSLTADWVIQQQTTYSIVIWKQKATDAPDLPDSMKTYDFYEYYGDKSGATGADASALASSLGSYTGLSFTGFNSGGRIEIESSDGSGRLLSDGSSIVNIYYDRKVHELQFYSSTGNNSLVRTIRELYQGLTMCWAISAADRKYISRYLRRMWIRLLFSPPVRVLKRTDES